MVALCQRYVPKDVCQKERMAIGLTAEESQQLYVFLRDPYVLQVVLFLAVLAR